MAEVCLDERVYIDILKSELVPALGCTEPIALAYAAAKARQVLGSFPDRIEIRCSGNIIKNVKGVVVPNSGGLKGVDVAAVLGVVGGNADRHGDPEHHARPGVAGINGQILPYKAWKNGQEGEFYLWNT